MVRFMKVSRRKFLRIASVFTSVTFSGLWSKLFLIKGKASASEVSPPYKHSSVSKNQNLGVDEDGFSRVYMVKNASPEQNMKKAIEMMGGIEKFIGPSDIVVLKPNAQWWNQGMTNTDAMKGFIDMVLAMPDFSGEVIVAENHQYNGDNSRGWNTSEKNGKFNFNELVAYYQKRGKKNVTKYHWRVAGRTAIPLEGDAQGDRRVKGPEDGDGYVWMEDCYYLSPIGKKCIMTYPVFTSTYSGITVDLKNGAWKNGSYLADKEVRFINFSALNHHGWYCGITASVKNLMGVVDMSCGFPGDAPKGTYNTHHIGVSKLKLLTKKRVVWRIGRIDKFMRYCYRDFHHTGGALGYFMSHVRMPDLNIITGERIGWGSRVDLEKSFQPKTILASRDPVAIDYIAAREVLLPGTPSEAYHQSGLTYQELNNPDEHEGPYRKFLKETEKQGVGNLSPEKIRLVTYAYGSSD